MRADASFAVPVKLWALLCVFAGVTIGGNVLLTCILTGGALLYLVLQRNFRLAASYGCFYLLLALLLYGIRFHGLRMPVFSEFYVLMFWNLSPIFLVSWDLITTPPGMLSAFLSRLRMPTPFILGLLVVFRFFPTMRTELKGVGRSMKNRGLTAAGQLLAHPVQSMEYVLVPFLLRVLQLADQLSVSAVARGAERPGVRGSYYEKKAGARDLIAAAACALVTASYLANREIYGDFTLEQLLSELQERYIYTQKTADECRKGNYKSLISIIQSNCFVISNLNNERLIRQSGAFLLCGQCNITLNQSDPGKSVIQKASGSVVSEFEEGVFRIPADQKEAILEELDFYNINEGALFPELEHQMTYIKKLQSNKVAASV